MAWYLARATRLCQYRTPRRGCVCQYHRDGIGGADITMYGQADRCSVTAVSATILITTWYTYTRVLEPWRDGCRDVPK
eukprot:1421070-Rhodomonas_salina.4